MSTELEHEIVSSIRKWLAATSTVELPSGLSRDEAHRRAQVFLNAIIAGTVGPYQVEADEDLKDILWASVEELDGKPLGQRTFEECDRFYQFVLALTVENDPFEEREEILHRVAVIGWRSAPGGLEVILRARAKVWEHGDEARHRQVCESANQLQSQTRALGAGPAPELGEVAEICARLFKLTGIHPGIVAPAAAVMTDCLTRKSRLLGWLDDSEYLKAVTMLAAGIAERHLGRFDSALVAYVQAASWWFATASSKPSAKMWPSPPTPCWWRAKASPSTPASSTPSAPGVNPAARHPPLLPRQDAAVAEPPPQRPPQRPRPPPKPPLRARGPEDRPQTTSWVKIADEISVTDGRIATARAAGFTTAVTFPTRGIFAGQGAVIDLLTGEKSGEMIVSSPAGQYISVGRGGGGGGMGGGFPGALMGYIAYIRQIYLDAEHYKLVKDTYAKNPVGMTRPEYDRALEGVLDSPRILLPANRLVEIDRMLRLARDLKQPVILYGGRETFRPEAAALLKKSNTPILLSMRWPEAPRDADPEESDTMRTLEMRDKAALAPSVLQKAGVKFAFYSDGLDAPRDLQRAVKKALDNGLSREDALRALTLTPAEIYGVSNRLGSIETGKIANLVVTRGDIFDDRTKIEMTLVDGRKYVPAPEPAPTGGRGAATADGPGVK